ncbi:antibiotic biosynthesis monooxygenase family protein [Ruegeria sp. 2205SS24-7]|uniref:antibiotic biosynthesis monooxygenase family protein n=1 Tax=Ruegeria discodermiae TaxID=3064389 RepID=UPI002741056B|nr:antibiotic biosynthesis monooxygenase family protein [Ruegeria sp. 2205SS24-7]MDP5220163.1 antibiotic biosynthesis monooxygenase family protein [Ruegeria sp. 2205SS24-7]
MTSSGPVLRIFEVQVKDGHVEELLENFATTSSKVVEGHPGNRGYFFGRCIQGGDNMVMFVSIWDDLDAVKKRFGDDWLVSYLPDGYEDLIDSCSIRHVDVGSGWNI